MTDPSEGRIGHAELRIGGSVAMLAGVYPDFGAVIPVTIVGSAVTLHLATKTVDADLDRATQAGAAMLGPATDQSLGERTALVVDPFGHRWMLSQTIENGHPQRHASSLRRGNGSMKQDELALRAAKNAINAAMISNNVRPIRDCITSDWDLVTPERGPISGEGALGAIGSGVLGHHMMVRQGAPAPRLRRYRYCDWAGAEHRLVPLSANRGG